jgi:tRNA-dihydrouridine synthase B
MFLNWATCPRPIIALSPMADMTDSAFCRVVRLVAQHNPEPAQASRRVTEESSHQVIIFREMVSAEAVVRDNEKTLGMTAIHDDERPLVQQLFGSNPNTMAEAARIIEAQHRPEGFDINMGCPVYKIVHNFNGAALMREPKLASEIVRAMKSAITVPLSVKIRSGWSNPRECFEFAHVLEEAGADLITVHGRTKSQGYSGKSDWNLIGELAKTLSIPLLANGDAHTAPLAIDALKTTGAAGVMIARGALGNPWIFSHINDLLAGCAPTPVTNEERVRVIKLHLRYHLEQYGERGVTTFRKHLSWYFRGVPGAKPFKERLHTSCSANEVLQILDEFSPSSLPS